MSLKATGFEALDRELAKLPLKLQKQAMRRMVRGGAAVVQKDAKQKAPKKSGRLKSAIIVRAKPARDTKPETIAALVLIRTKTTKRGKIAPHAHLLEYGHQLVKGGKLGSGGRVIGFVAARPFMRPAFDNNISKIINVMRRILGREIREYKKG
jgi:HK97 gp10 family phage protein